jgi:hypothetical protein
LTGNSAAPIVRSSDKACGTLLFFGQESMDWRYNTIWFDQIDANKVATIDYKDRTTYDFGNLEYITLRHYKQPNRSLNELPISKKVLYLALHLGTHLRQLFAHW